MYYLVINRLVGMLKNKGYIKDKYDKVVNVAAEYIVALVINIILASGIGHTFQIEKELIVFSIFYTILRVSTGGNYLKLDLKSSITRWILGVLLIRVAEIIEFEMSTKWIMVAFLVISFVAVLGLAPYRANRMNLLDQTKQTLRKRSVLTISLWSLVLLPAMLLFENIFIIAAVIGLFVQSLSLLSVSVESKHVVELNQCIYING